MKRLIMNLTVGFLLVSSLIFAQSEETQHNMPMMGSKQIHQGMMGHSMMHGMSMTGTEDPIITQLCHFGCPGFLLELTDELDLSEKQISDLKTLMTDYEKYATMKKADIQVAKIELSELMDMTKPNFSKVRNKMNEIAAIEKDLRFSFLNAVEKSRNLLSGDQLKMLQTYKMKKNTGKMGGGMMKHGMEKEIQM